MHPEPVQDLLRRLEVVRDVCDLDLLVFLHRHPRAMVPSDQLASFIGCDRERTARSLENLIAAGIAARRQGPASAVPMIHFVGDDRQREPLASLLALASTRNGRAQVLQALAAAEGTHD
ncbi:MAG TPA: hypothetical protein VNJ70_02280 [Thermoanaerobaculia bacterium]|nr:hypothetical protein [Thermoanaerobaculia bacterium]